MPTLLERQRKEAAEIKSIQPSEIDPHPNITGVLLSDEIIFYVQAQNLIRPFDPRNLKPAGYELTIGDEYFLSGSFYELDASDDEKNTITIPPFDVAVLKTAEILCLPRYLIARWNIRVRHAYSGLLWVGGPQVDPGYVGHLFCPIYNLSDKPVTLHIGDPIALIDFVKTTPFDPSKPDSVLVRYHPPSRIFLQDYGIEDLRSALFTRAGQKLVEFEEQIRNLESRFIVFTQVSFAIFALVIALIAIISRVNAESIMLSTAVFGAATISLSVAAIGIALFSYVRGRVGRLVYEQYGRVMGSRASTVHRYFRRQWWLGMTISIAIAFGAMLMLHEIMDPAFRDLRQQRFLTKHDLEGMNTAVRQQNISTSAELQNFSRRVDELAGRIADIERQASANSSNIDELKKLIDERLPKTKPSQK